MDNYISDEKLQELEEHRRSWPKKKAIIEITYQDVRDINGLFGIISTNVEVILDPGATNGEIIAIIGAVSGAMLYATNEVLNECPSKKDEELTLTILKQATASIARNGNETVQFSTHPKGL